MSDPPIQGWPTPDEYAKMFAARDSYKTYTSLGYSDNGFTNHPRFVYDNPIPTCYFLPCGTLKEFGFPRVPGLKKQYQYKKMCFHTDVPKHSPKFRYITARCEKSNDPSKKAVIRVHAVMPVQRIRGVIQEVGGFVLVDMRSGDIRAQKHRAKPKRPRPVKNPVVHRPTKRLRSSTRMQSIMGDGALSMLATVVADRRATDEGGSSSVETGSDADDLRVGEIENADVVQTVVPDHLSLSCETTSHVRRMPPRPPPQETDSDAMLFRGAKYLWELGQESKEGGGKHAAALAPLSRRVVYSATLKGTSEPNVPMSFVFQDSNSSEEDSKSAVEYQSPRTPLFTPSPLRRPCRPSLLKKKQFSRKLFDKG